MRNFPCLTLFLASLVLSAGARVVPVPVPVEIQSTQFSVTVNGQPVDVAHAAASYDYVSFDLALPQPKPVTVAITASEDGFWDQGVDIQPWRLGIRPVRSGRTITFPLSGPAKLSISRPGDFLNHAKMLFLFAGRPPAPAPPESSTVHIVPAGVLHESINPKSGETWYLTPGAVIFGSLNLWRVDNVKILGRGVIVYQGPQNPEDDDGWMQKPDWHCIGALESHHIQITGLTCLVRSRTWSIQMKDSGDFLYEDLRVIGGNPGNANQDGMDWLGGGDTIVRDAFFRASDDVLAMQGNWDGYHQEDLVRPGHDVQNILVEHSVLSTSISNIVRAGWPEKVYNSRNFTLRDSDILHTGIGSCGPPFGLFTFWGAKGAKGTHDGFTFQNLWLDDWYSLFQIEQEEPALSGFHFTNIWALDQPPLVDSSLQGQVKDIHLDNVKIAQTSVLSDAQVPLMVSGGAEEPQYTAGNSPVHAYFDVTPLILAPGNKAQFTAQPSPGVNLKYTWLFGDGTTAQGRKVTHAFPDSLGTQLDGDALGAGRFRVLLKVEDKAGHQDWAAQGLVVVSRWREAQPEKADTPGLDYRIYPGTWPDFPDFTKERVTKFSDAATLAAAEPGGYSSYATVYDGLIDIPVDGGYSFHLLARDGARLTLDGLPLVATGPPFGEVCGSPLNAMRYARGSIGLRAGKHTLHLESLQTVSPGVPRLLWRGPGIHLTDVPAAAFSHLAATVIEANQPVHR